MLHRENRLRGLSGLTLRQLEWLAILLPLLFLGVVYFLVLGPAHPLIHRWVGFISLAVGVIAAVLVFTRSVFGAVRTLQVEVEELSAETQSYNRRLVSLQEANLALMRETHVEQAFEGIAAIGASVLSGCHAALVLRGEGAEPRTIIRSGPGTSEAGCALERSAPGDVARMPVGPRLVSAPVAYLDSLIGTLVVARSGAAQPFDSADGEIARMFATHAALVVQNDRLYDEVRALAIEAERQALAREMHDSLAQVLAFVNTKAQAVEQYLRRDDLNEARQQMAELSAAAREVYSDIRQGIAALRVDMAGKTLRELVEEYTADFADAAHVGVELDWQIERTPDLPPAAEVQLLRVVQEALSNVRRHAGADLVELRASAGEDGLTITIRDDGRGFDVSERSADGRPRFGLQTMRERTAAIGGTLEVQSEPGSGTTVIVRLPSVEVMAG